MDCDNFISFNHTWHVPEIVCQLTKVESYILADYYTDHRLASRGVFSTFWVIRVTVLVIDITAVMCM